MVYIPPHSQYPALDDIPLPAVELQIGPLKFSCAGYEEKGVYNIYDCDGVVAVQFTQEMLDRIGADIYEDPLKYAPVVANMMPKGSPERKKLRKIAKTAKRIDEYLHQHREWARENMRRANEALFIRDHLEINALIEWWFKYQENYVPPPPPKVPKGVLV